MKRLIVSGSICVLSLLASCSPGEGTIESCTSAYVGSFEGTITETGVRVTGEMIGQLDGINGKLQILMTSEGLPRDYTGDSMVDDAGSLASASGASVGLDGTFDFDDCAASGNWSLAADATGTWRLELPDSAL